VMVQEYVWANQPALAKVQQALLFSTFHYPVDFSYGPDTPLPHLGRLKEIAHLISLESFLRSESNDSDAWTECIALQLKLARTVDDEPTLISHLVRSSMLRIAAKATERNLTSATPDGEACKRLQRAFTQITRTNLLPSALIGERAMLIPVFRMSWKELQSFSQPDDQQPQPRSPQRFAGKPMTLLWLTGFVERDLLCFLGAMKRFISDAAVALPQALAVTNNYALNTKRGCIMSRMLVPSFANTLLREASTQASLELAATALAVERFRIKTGYLPAALGELTPEFLDTVPVDPFDGAPLRYRVLSKGYVLYSVDADGGDDGGKERPDRKKSPDSATYDLTFIVER
jgi:hypothetical protein